MTQTQIVQTLADKCEINKKTAKSLLDALALMAVTEVKKNGLFVLPGIGRLVRVARKARMGREAIKIAAKTGSRSCARSSRTMTSLMHLGSAAQRFSETSGLPHHVTGR